MTKDEALKLALKAMLNFPEDISDEMFEAITAIKEALANVSTSDTSQERVDEMQKQRHEQEPVAWINEHELRVISENVTPTVGHRKLDDDDVPLYTSPPQRKPLTDEEIDYIYTGIRAVHHEINSYVFARAIEAKLKQKNGYAEENT